jgi:photosystem II stability/assembly factor-like uncharacterized protein
MDMRRTFLKYAVGAAATASWLGVAPGARAADTPARRYKALDEASLPSGKVGGAAYFGIAKAGKRLVCVGERGIVVYSDDEGASWQQAKVPVSVTLTAVQFVNDRAGWATGHLGVVLHTRDGGVTWTKQLDGLRAASLAAETATTPDAEAFAKTLQQDGPDKPFFDLSFDDAQHGLVLGAYNLAFRTDDAGASWKPFMTQIDNPKGLHMYAAHKRGGDLYVVGEQGLLLKRTEGSERLESLKSPFPGTFFGVAVSRQGALLAFGLRGKAFVSDDQAVSWYEATTGVSSSIASGLGLTDGRFLLVTQAGDVLVSDDGGRAFKRVAVKEPLPLTSLLETGKGQVLATSLRGVRRLGPL